MGKAVGLSIRQLRDGADLFDCRIGNSGYFFSGVMAPVGFFAKALS